MFDNTLSEISRAYRSMCESAKELALVGFSEFGYDSDGRDVLGCDRSGYDSEGYDALGFDREGWSREGAPSPRRNPEIYGISDDEVDDFVRNEIERRKEIALKKLVGWKKAAHDVKGLYPKPVNTFRNASPAALMAAEYAERAEMELDDRKPGANAATAPEEDPEMLARSERRKAELSAKRRTDEFRKKNAEYMRDYNRAKRLLYGGKRGMHRWTAEDIIWAKSNPTFLKMEKKKAEKDRASEEAYAKRHGFVMAEPGKGVWKGMFS